MDINNFSLRELLKLVPVDEETRNKLLEMESEMSVDEKYRLSKICWLILRLIKREEYHDKVMSVLEGIARGTRKYSKNEFESFEKDIVDSLSQKLQLLDTEKQVSTLREQLEQLKTQSSTA